MTEKKYRSAIIDKKGEIFPCRNNDFAISLLSNSHAVGGYFGKELLSFGEITKKVEEERKFLYNK